MCAVKTTINNFIFKMFLNHFNNSYKNSGVGGWSMAVMGPLSFLYIKDQFIHPLTESHHPILFFFVLVLIVFKDSWLQLRPALLWLCCCSLSFVPVVCTGAVVEVMLHATLCYMVQATGGGFKSWVHILGSNILHCWEGIVVLIWECCIVWLDLIWYLGMNKWWPEIVF